MPTEHLILGDVDGIQEFVFSSFRLREMVGASLIVRELHEIVRELHGEGIPEDAGQSSSEDGSADPDDFRVVRNSGGSLCLVVKCVCESDEDGQGKPDGFAHLLNVGCSCPAHRLCDELRTRFADRSRGGRLSLTPPVPRGFEAFEQAKQLLEYVKRSGGARAEPRMAPHFLRCSSCGLEPAVIEIEDRDIGPIGAQCQKKRMVGNERVGSGGNGDPWWFSDWEREREGEGPVRSARHFEEIAGDGLLAIVLADVDGLGAASQELLESIKTEDGNKGSSRVEQAYRLLSLMLVRRIRDAVAKALSPDRVPLREDENGDGAVLPAQVLLTGGDDVAIALPGSSALAVAEAVSQEFRERDLSGEHLLEEVWDGEVYGSRPPEEIADKVVDLPLGVSAAAVVTGAHFPVRDSREIAGGLLGRAKAAARRNAWEKGGLHYAVISEAAADLPAIAEDWSYTLGNADPARDPYGLVLTGQPYRLGEGRGGWEGASARSLERFRAAIEVLRANEFPTNKLSSLRRLFGRVWLLDEGFPSVPGKEEIDRARCRLEDEYGVWRGRVMRQKSRAETWRKVEKRLGLEHGSGPEASPWYSESGDDEPWRTPLPDLADAVGLWEP